MNVDLTEQTYYWQQHLPSSPPALLTPLLDFPRPPVQTFIRADETLRLRSDKVQQFCKREDTPLFTLLLTTLNALLLRHTNQNKLIVGTLSPDSRRENGELFVNPVPLLLQIDGTFTGRQALDVAQQTIVDVTRHRDVPFDQLVTQIGSIDLDRAPLFQTMLLTPGHPSLTETPLTHQHMAASARYTTTCDLVLVAELLDHHLQITAQYDAQLFEPITIRKLLERWHILLAALITDPDAHLLALPMLTPSERRRILVEWNATQVEYPREATISQVFEAQAAQMPQAVALEFTTETLTYTQLNCRANQLARHLRALGVGSETPVTLFMQRSVDMIVAILGILKAGGTYVPLDPTYPAERIRLMLDETRSPLILTQQHLVDSLPPHSAQLIRLDADRAVFTPYEESNLPAVNTAQNLAYIMYTSGSTGRPKGIEVPHRGVVRLVKGANYANLSPDEVFLQLAPVSFDASTFEIWGALLNGAKLVLMPPAPPSLAELARAIEHHQISTLWLTAGLFHQMAEAHPAALAGVRQLLAGGDVLQAEPVRAILRHMQPLGHRLINGYGPTENTTFTCCHPMTDPAQVGNTVPIGRPVSNTQVYILNDALQPQPPGIPGELYIAGDGLARGYLNQPELTNATFIPALNFATESESSIHNSQFIIHNPQFYRSGDLARWLPNGSLEFLGRLDQQVKIRGFRIELGEIEVRLNQHTAVAEAVVQALQNAEGTKYLVAYVVPAVTGDDQPVPLNRGDVDLQRVLMRHLQLRLPTYMLPAAIVFLDQIPLNPNGKVDRAALPRPDVVRPEIEAAFVAPATPLEQTLADLWHEVLGFERIGTQDDFFALGGHSLLATQLVSRIQTTFRVDLPLQTLFENPTINSLARVLKQHESKPGQIEAVARLRQQIKTMSPAEKQALLQQKRR